MDGLTDRRGRQEKADTGKKRYGAGAVCGGVCGVGWGEGGGSGAGQGAGAGAGTQSQRVWRGTGQGDCGWMEPSPQQVE